MYRVGGRGQRAEQVDVHVVDARHRLHGRDDLAEVDGLPSAWRANPAAASAAARTAGSTRS